MKRGDQVKAAEPLFALEQDNEAAQRREAADRVARAQAQLANLQKAKRPSEIEAVRAELVQAEANLKLAEANLRRQEDLYRANYVSGERLDDARNQAARARGQVEEMRAQLATARLAARPDEIRAAEAEVAAARATLAQADWRLAQKAQRSPQDALVQDTLFVQGEWVPAGAPVVNLLPPGNIKVRFFVPETQVGALKRGAAGHPRLRRLRRADPRADHVHRAAGRVHAAGDLQPRAAGEARLPGRGTAGVADAPKLHPGQPVEVTLK